ncbi:MAG: hypothetical protein H7196_00300 [candidate division SR1 bacterium]|nr:hypothetical protein [candidate division SR1 bacterium]
MEKTSITKQIQIKRSIVSLENIAKEDINFPEFCFGVMGKTPKDKQPEELVFVDKRNPDAKISIYKSKHGLPTQFTRDLRYALIRIAQRKNNLMERKVPIKGDEIMEELGLSRSGKNLSIIKKHLEILTGTNINFQNNFFDKSTNQQIENTVSFNILQAFSITSKKQMKTMDQSLEGFFMWNEYYWDKSIINGRNLIDMDYMLYRLFDGDITKQLYLFLNKRSYKSKTLRLELDVLAYEKLGISRTRSLTKIRFDLKKSHDQLLKNNFLESLPEYSNFNEKMFITYEFNQQLRLEVIADENVQLTQGMSITNDLEKYGFTKGQVSKMIIKYGNDVIEKTIKFYEFSSKNQIIRIPKKWILASLDREFDTSDFDTHEQSLFETVKLEELEKEDKERKIQNEIDNKRKSEIADAEIREWIGNNSGSYASLCTDYLETLKESNPIIYNSLLEKSRKLKVSALQTLMDNKIYNTEIRSNIYTMIQKSKF